VSAAENLVQADPAEELRQRRLGALDSLMRADDGRLSRQLEAAGMVLVPAEHLEATEEAAALLKEASGFLCAIPGIIATWAESARSLQARITKRRAGLPRSAPADRPVPNELEALRAVEKAARTVLHHTRVSALRNAVDRLDVARGELANRPGGERG
jgi:hypothetical protein